MHVDLIIKDMCATPILLLSTFPFFYLACLKYETNSYVQDFKFQIRVLLAYTSLTQLSSWRYFIQHKPFLYYTHTIIIVILWRLLFNFGVLIFRF